MFHIREITEKDHPWINENYKQIGFVASDFTKEKLVVAEDVMKVIGVGRLVPLNDGSWELGGIFVSERNRGSGVAKAIVASLIEISDRTKPLYCLPFVELVKFYQSFGFREIMDLKELPKDLLNRTEYCKKTFQQGIKILKMQMD